MNTPTIHVHTASDKATVGYVSFMWETMRALASHPQFLKLSVHGIGPSAATRLAHLPAAQAYQVPTDANSESGSNAHAACVEHALSMTDDGDIHVICDSDTVVMAKGWDDYVRTKLLDDGFGIIGTAVEDIGGMSSGTSTVQMAKNLPTVAWCALSPLHRWRGLQAKPSKGSNIDINTDELSRIYNLPVGYGVLRDVAWQIPQYLYDNGIKYLAWRQLKPSNPTTVLKGKGITDYHEEYHVDENVPFVVHQRGSLRHGYRSEGTSAIFYDAVDRHLVNERVLESPRWKWESNEKNHNRLLVIEGMTKARGSHDAIAVPIAAAPATQSETPTTSVGSDKTLVEGWFKISFDGVPIFQRGKPVTKTINVNFMPNSTIRHLRLEGPATGVTLMLPDADAVPHLVLVRNITAGAVTVKTSMGPKVAEVPIYCNQLLVVDVDGVSKVG